MSKVTGTQSEGCIWVAQGGTCVLVGDDSARIAEAERVAEAEIGCKVLRTSTYFRPEGHVQVPGRCPC